MAPQLATKPRTTTSDRMLADCSNVACGACRAVLMEMRGAVHDGEDTDGWWREQFTKAHATVRSGKHVHLERP